MILNYELRELHEYILNIEKNEKDENISLPINSKFSCISSLSM